MFTFTVKEHTHLDLPPVPQGDAQERGEWGKAFLCGHRCMHMDMLMNMCMWRLSRQERTSQELRKQEAAKGTRPN